MSDVTVRVDESDKTRFAEIVAGLEKAGLSEVSCAPRLGMVHGKIDPSYMDSLRGVAGVQSVRVSAKFRAI